MCVPYYIYVYPNKFVLKLIVPRDSRQLGPAVREAKTSTDIVAASLRSSLRHLHLTVPHRQAGSDDHAAFLMQVGNGSLPQQILADDDVAVVGLSQVPMLADRAQLIDFVFPRHLVAEPDECANRAVLCTHNVDVGHINESVLNQSDGEEIVCASV